MGIVDDFERRLEKMVDGAFSRAFKSEIEPSEIGRRLLRAMEGGKSVSVAAVYVPNAYVIGLGPGDFERFEGLIPSLRQEFVDLLKANARERRWRPAGPVDVRFERDEQMKAGQFEVQGFHEAAAEGEGIVRASASLTLVNSEIDQSWELDSPTLVLGRAAGADIVLQDSNVSRSHAQLVRRDDEWWIIDNGSTNGTLVNGTLIKERRLSHGDLIKVGSTELEYRENPGL